MKRLEEMMAEEIHLEVGAWGNGDYADGTWVDAPEAIIRQLNNASKELPEFDSQGSD